MGLSSYTEVPPDFVGQTLNSAACSLFQHKFRSGLLCASFFVSFVWLVASAALFCIPELGTIRGHERERIQRDVWPFRPDGEERRVLTAEDIWGWDFGSENTPFSFESDRPYSALALFNLYKALNSDNEFLY